MKEETTKLIKQQSAVGISASPPSNTTQNTQNTHHRFSLADCCLSYHIPIGLTILITIGIVFPAPGMYMSKTCAQTVFVCIIFLISGTQLKTEEVKHLVHQKFSTFLGLLIILVLTPLFAIPVLLFHYSKPEFLTGIAIFLCSPTTLSSGVVLVGEAKGNVTLALVLVVCSCSLSIFTEPLILKLIFRASSIPIKFDVVVMLTNLLLTILLPIVVGKCLTGFIPPIKRFCQRFKTPLKLFSSLCLIMVPWMKLSASHSKLVGLDLGNFLFLVCTAVGVHVGLFILIFIFTWICRVSYAEKKAITILGSEKTLPVAFTVLNVLPESLGDHGLIVLPMIFGHFTQLLIDAFFCAGWSTYDKKYHPELYDDTLVSQRETEMRPIEVEGEESLPLTFPSSGSENSSETPNKKKNKNKKVYQQLENDD